MWRNAPAWPVVSPRFPSLAASRLQLTRRALSHISAHDFRGPPEYCRNDSTIRTPGQNIGLHFDLEPTSSWSLPSDVVLIIDPAPQHSSLTFIDNSGMPRKKGKKRPGPAAPPSSQAHDLANNAYPPFTIQYPTGSIKSKKRKRGDPEVLAEKCEFHESLGVNYIIQPYDAWERMRPYNKFSSRAMVTPIRLRADLHSHESDHRCGRSHVCPH